MSLHTPGLAAGMAEVESRMTDLLQDRSDWVTRIARHTAAAGGKRLRPMLCLLAGAFGRPDRRDRVIRAAAGLELIHLATLIHDDVVDRAETRRGHPTVSALWGNSLSVLTGDWLFAASFELLYADDDARLIRLTARMVRELCAGAIEEAERSGTLVPDLPAYYDRIYRKTAVFLETACRVGATAAGAPPDVETALGAFGRRVGMAFQIVDDILDFTGDPARTGKPAGGDLRNGIATLPMILGHRHPEARRLLERTFGRVHADPSTVRSLTETLARVGALEEALRAARDLAEQGKRSLRPFRGAGPVDDLAALADLAVERDR